MFDSREQPSIRQLNRRRLGAALRNVINQPGCLEGFCTEPSGVGVVLEQLDHVSQSVPQLRGAAHLVQHAEQVGARDALAADVGEQIGVVGRLAQDDLGVVCVEVDLEGGRHTDCMSGDEVHNPKWVNGFSRNLFTGLRYLIYCCILNHLG